MSITNRPSKRASKFTAAMLAATMLISTLPASAEPKNRTASCTIPVISQGEPSDWLIENSLHTIQNYPWYKRHSLYWGYRLNIDILKEYTNLNIQCSKNYDNFAFLNPTDRDYLQYLLEPFISTNVLVRKQADKIYRFATEWDTAIVALYRLDPTSAKAGYNQLLGLADYLEDPTANPLSPSRLEAFGRDLYAAIGDTISLWGSKSGAEADKNLKEARALGGFLLGSVYNSLPDQASRDSFNYGENVAKRVETLKVTSLGFEIGVGSAGVLATVGISAKKLIKWQNLTQRYFGQSRRYWTQNPITFNGNKVYQRNDLINPNRIDTNSGLTNRELMQAGRAPIGPDGKSINLHHMIQKQDGPIAEVTQTFHQQNFRAIHINTGGIPSGINRSQFNSWRRSYWINRANDF